LKPTPARIDISIHRPRLHASTGSIINKKAVESSGTAPVKIGVFGSDSYAYESTSESLSMFPLISSPKNPQTRFSAVGSHFSGAGDVMLNPINLGVDAGGFELFVAEELLDQADVVPDSG
jgi:hypothetical protein